MRSRWTSLVICCLVTGLFGCDSGPMKPKWPDPVKVSGKVTYKGQPFEHGTVQFIPSGQTVGQGGIGTVDATGKYVATMRNTDGKIVEGLIPGSYKVAFSRFKKPDGKYWVPGPDSEGGPANFGAMEELPPNLSDVATSQYTVDISKDKPTYDFEIQ